MKKNTLIKIENLKKSFKLKTGKVHEVLKGINLDIIEGQNISIIGSNGAGKTTLLETVVGLRKYDSGSIHYNLGVEKGHNNQIGIQFQESSYPSGLNVWEIIFFIINIYKVKIDPKELQHIIEVFGIKDFYNQRAKSLSGGQKQRLNLLLSIIHKPKIIILDEISTGLDILSRESIKLFIKEFAKKNNSTIVLVSHDYSEIEFLTERIVVLKEGNIVQDLSVKKIKEQWQSLEKFIIKNI